jgi:hypothetical protein
MAKSKATNTPRRSIRCYLCGHTFDVSGMTMSVPCPHCHKALKVEDVHVKSYVPVNDLQTCGKITVARNGRVVARVIRAGEGIECEGTLEGAIEADDRVLLADKANWKGKSLVTRSLVVEDGAKLYGQVKVPWIRPAPAAAKAVVATTEMKPIAHAEPASPAIESPSMP